jgi:prepilin-type N-terminal cleavage/methylation domain-containing protein
MHVKQGVTLIELLVVITLISMCCYMAVSHFSHMNIYARNELDLLHQVCTYMQRRALVTGQQQTIHLNLHNNSYTFNGRTHQLARGAVFGIMPVKGPPSSPHSVLQTPCTFKHNVITFYPDGIIDAGSVYLTNDNHSALYALTNAVSSYSYLRTYCYADTWRMLE